MPYSGIVEGERVVPPVASDEETIKCPACDERMSIVHSHSRGSSFVSRHFRHQGESDCPGESDTHLRWKSIAYSKLENRYPDATITFEGTVGDRRTDVLVEFESPEASDGLGEGLCVEVQYKHENKDIEAVTSDFLTHEYSVLWLGEEQYNGDDVDLDDGRLVEWWLQKIPSEDEWTGYHRVVHWLRQTNYSSVELEVPTWFDEKDTVESWGLQGAWLEGVRKRDGDTVPIRYPCGSCNELMTQFVPASYRFNPKEHYHTSSYWMDLKFSGHECPHCESDNNVRNHAIRTVSKFDQSDEWTVSTFANPDSVLYVPCMQCGAALSFSLNIETTSGTDYKTSLLSVVDSVKCSECESVISSYHDEIRILTPRD